MKHAGFLVLAVAMSTVLGGCRQADGGAKSPVTGNDTATSVAATGAATKTLAVDDAYLVLPAVPGRPGAAYFTIVNHSDTPATLTAVTVAGAREAQMHQTSGGSMEALASVDIPAGGSIAFAPGGRHVMVFGLPTDLHAGGTSALTATFEGGRKLSATVPVRAAGSGEAMHGMKM